MILAVFGSRVFEIRPGKILTFDGLQYGSSLATEKQDADGKKPSTYIKGPGLDSLALSVPVKLQAGPDPMAELEGWRSVMHAALPEYLVIGGRPFGQNRWLMIDVQMADTEYDGSAKLTACTLNLKFEEYVRPGSAPAVSSSAAKGIKSKSGNPAPVIMSAAEKESLKSGGW